MPEDIGSGSDEEARDALHILPLSALPLETSCLRRARLVKNVRLQTAVELFNDIHAGSGQIAPGQLPQHLGFRTPELERDLVKITRIAQAPSFDVYTLRIELRRLSINVEEHESLRLSDARKTQLTRYMRVFTRPLIETVYGTDEVQVESVDDLIRIFTAPDVAEVRRRLRLLADRLDIPLTEIPAFLQEYGDIFLSLAYFKERLDDIVPDVQAFLAWTDGIRASNEIRRDARHRRLLDDVGRDLTEISTSITGRFESFDNRSRDFWRDINATSFRSIRELITAHHVTIGGVLCGLAVKMNLWKARFASGGGPIRRMEFVRSEILPGLSHIKALERSARGERTAEDTQ
ncbi:hypothetical protein DEW08_19195 [Azospirillum thermophilum]|uniref:Uncharacterized protein n=1 Tax=Azospirillum thermophilum TaxID=2202148 RepID=A0A2S2CVK8_9PROT|nr:hypothetical protein DEW08_19195 [Azospirillum thermophilum]